MLIDGNEPEIINNAAAYIESNLSFEDVDTSTHKIKHI